VNVETIKLKVNDHTKILEIVPEKIQVFPNINLKRDSPKNTMVNISITDITRTIAITGLSSEMKLCLLLNFSDTR
jgi:hypothetical protein